MHAIGRIGRGAVAAGLLAAFAASFPVALACPLTSAREHEAANCAGASVRLGCTLADRHFLPANESDCGAASCESAGGACAADSPEGPPGPDTGSDATGSDGRAWCHGDPSSATRPASFGIDAAPTAPVTIEPRREPGRWSGMRAIAAERIVEPPPRARPPTRAPPQA